MNFHSEVVLAISVLKICGSWFKRTEKVLIETNSPHRKELPSLLLNTFLCLHVVTAVDILLYFLCVCVVFKQKKKKRKSIVLTLTLSTFMSLIKSNSSHTISDAKEVHYLRSFMVFKSVPSTQREGRANNWTTLWISAMWATLFSLEVLWRNSPLGRL